MTDKKINEMVAKKLGTYEKCWCFPTPCDFHIPDYYHDIKAAWDIVKEFKKRNFEMFLHNTLDGKWDCELNNPEALYQSGIGKAHTAPMAICLAFLKLNKREDTPCQK
jgi:hypothetical protein